MIRLVSGILAMALITLFLGGLAYSIWDNTDSIVFPIIVGIVLLMAYYAFVEELRSGDDSD